MIGCALVFALATLTPAGTAIWDLNPRSDDWNTTTNWTPMTVPNGPSDTATFGFSNITHITISADTEVNGIVFSANATNSYRIDVVATSVDHNVTLTISGSGITNNSGSRPFIRTVDASGDYPAIEFRGSASAGNVLIDDDGGSVSFFDRSTAGSAEITAVFSGIWFYNSSSAGGASIDTGATTSCAAAS